MDFDLSDEQKMLAKSGREFVKRYLPKSLIRELEDDPVGFRLDIWKNMASLGWIGWVVPPQYGGLGGCFLDLIPVLEELGRGCYQGPFITSLTCVAILLAAGSAEQKQSILPRMASGDAITVLAGTEPGTRPDEQGIQMTVRAEDGHWLLDGTKIFVPYAHVADYIVCVGRTARGVSLFLVDAKSRGMSIKLLRTLAGDRQCEVVFDGVQVPAANAVGEIGCGWPAFQKAIEFGALAQCGFISGVVQQVLENSVEYAKQRVQFDRPIASFQVIQHKCADMLADVESVKSLTYYAAWRLSQGLDAATEISVAKARASDASRRVCLGGHAIHGGIGITRDSDMQIYFRQAKAMELAFGNAEYHRELIALKMTSRATAASR